MRQLSRQEAFWMKKTIFKGAGVAIITPFTEDGVNFAELSRIIEDQIKVARMPSSSRARAVSRPR